ncbi:MAG: hypothetical protein MR912_12095 [Prevotella sp.]|nr:hypothetical protein [Prevotella sp.]
MKLKVPNKNYAVVELYDTVASLMGMETKDLNYDCRHINVARNIQDGFFAHYREENPNLSETEYKGAMAMLLVCYGPKTDEELNDDEVEVFDGFIC